MPALLVATAAGFSGYAALLPVAPMWAVHGGAGPAGAGAVNGILMLFTVLTQPFVPAALRKFGWGPVLVVGMVLLAVPGLAHLLTDALTPTLELSAIRGLGFGILTVTGSAAVAELVPSARRGAAIGAYGLAIAAPQVLLLPAAPWVAARAGFWVVFLLSAMPLLGCLHALSLGRILDDKRQAIGHHEPAGAAESRRLMQLPLLAPISLLLAVTIAGGAVITFAPQMSSSPALTTGGLLLLTATAALSRWRVGGLADRHGAQPFLWPLVLLTAAGLALTSWAVSEPETTHAAAFLIGTAALGVSYGGLQNLTLVVSFQAVPRAEYGLASAAWNVGFDTGTGTGAVAVGMIASGSSYSAALLVAAVVSLATLPLALRRRRPGS